MDTNIQLELGGGRNPLKHRYDKYKNYRNLDIIEHQTVDFKCDLRLGIPYKDHSISDIITIEFIEHLTYSELWLLFKDCYRVLVPRGTLYISCPNFKGCIEMFKSGNYFSYVISNILGNGQDPYDNHRSLWWPELLIDRLKDVGFSDVKDISEERLEELKNDKELLSRGMSPEEFVKFKIHIRAVK